MNRERRRASDIAGDVRAPKWMAIVMIAVALAMVLFVKCGAEEYTGEILHELVGDPELELPESYSDRLLRTHKNVSADAGAQE